MITQFTTKDQVIAFYREQMTKNEVAAIKGLLHVYANQTAAEQETKSTNLYNGVGFTGADARSCSIAASIITFKFKRGYVSEKQQVLLDRKMPKVREAMPKYARQIVEDLMASGKIVKNDKYYEFVK